MASSISSTNMRSCELGLCRYVILRGDGGGDVDEAFDKARVICWKSWMASGESLDVA